MTWHATIDWRMQRLSRGTQPLLTETEWDLFRVIKACIDTAITHTVLHSLSVSFSFHLSLSLVSLSSPWSLFWVVVVTWSCRWTSWLMSGLSVEDNDTHTLKLCQVYISLIKGAICGSHNNKAIPVTYCGKQLWDGLEKCNHSYQIHRPSVYIFMRHL